MAYSLITAQVRLERLSPVWTQVDVSQATVASLIAQYADVILILSSTVATGSVYLSRDALQSAMPLAVPSPTVSAWLSSLGNASLPTTASMPSQHMVNVHYQDAWHAGYVVKRSDVTRSPNSAVIPNGQPDLLLTKEGLDLYAMSQYLLATVNGFLHLTQGSVNGLYVNQGGITGLLGNDNEVGLLSFFDVGSLTLIPLESATLYKLASTQKYAIKMNVALPTSMAGKTLLLSLGGYFHALDGSYRVTGDKTFEIDTNQIPWAQRIYQSMKQIDLSSLPLETSPNNPQQVTVESLYSDETFAAYLKLSQSFAILLDAKTPYRVTHSVETPKLPGRFYRHDVSCFPLMGPLGKLIEYRMGLEDGLTTYCSVPVNDPHYLFSTTQYLTDTSISDNKQGYRARTAAQPYLLELGALVD